MKKSLIISENEKYGRKPVPSEMGAAESEVKPRKFAPTITLTGAQVDAFCGCDMKVGDKGTAKVHFIVKAASSGDQYGEDVPGKKSDQKLTLSLTHVEADEKSKAKEDDAEDDDSEEEKLESDSEEKSEGEVDEADETGEGAASDKVSPKDAGFDD